MSVCLSGIPVTSSSEAFSHLPPFPTRVFEAAELCLWLYTVCLHGSPQPTEWERDGSRKGRTAGQKRKSLPKQSSPNAHRSGRLTKASWRCHCFGWLVRCQILPLSIQAVSPMYYLWYIHFYHSTFSAGQSSLTLSENCFAKRQQMVEAIHYPILYSCLISPPRVLYLSLSKLTFSPLLKHSKNVLCTMTIIILYTDK